MKIIKTLDVSRQFIFDQIAASSLYDIYQHTGRSPKIASLTGLEYKKTFGKHQSGRIKFDDVEEPSVYAFTTSTNKNIFKTRWELHKLDDKSTDVIITETSQTLGMVQNINDTVMSFIFGKVKKRQMLAILDDITTSYHGR